MGRLTHTVSGSIASLRTPSRVPIESLKFHFLPKQASGTPSPENPIPIEGWTGLNGKRSGKNLIKPYYTNVTTISDLTITPTEKGVRVQGTASAEQAVRLSSQDIRFLDEGEKYTFSLYVNGDISGCKDPYIGYFDGVSYWGTMCSLTQQNNYKFTWTVPNRYATSIAPWFDMYIRVREGSIVDFEIGVQMEAGENATDYEPYSGVQIPITFPVSRTNILDIEQTSKINAGASGSTITIQNGVISIDAVASSARSFVMFSQVFPAGTYTIRAAYSGSVTKPRLLTTIEIANSSYNSYYSAYSKQLASEYMSFIANEPFSIGLVLSNSQNESGNPGSLYDIQLEHGDVVHNYEPYSSDNTFYGGYVDPVAGEIVAEYGSYTFTGISEDSLTYTKENTTGGKTRHQFHTTVLDGIAKNLSIRYAYSNIASANLWDSPDITNDNLFYIGTPSKQVALYVLSTECDATVESFNSWLSEHPWTIVFQLAEPIHIPIPAEDMKAFLDHNNFWSDANDDTEVTYPVTESRDMLTTRKKAIAFDQGKRRKVRWNQWIRPLTSEYWSGYSDEHVSVAFDNEISTSTWLSDKIGYMTSVKSKNTVSPNQIVDEIWYGSYMLNPSKSGLSWGIEMCGGVQLNCTSNTPSGEWTHVSAIAKAQRTNRGILYIANLKTTKGSDIGMTAQAKAPIHINLTQMFGAGNEPSTVAEFERICAINGIDLTTYQPYDEGSDRWLIIP